MSLLALSLFLACPPPVNPGDSGDSEADTDTDTDTDSDTDADTDSDTDTDVVEHSHAVFTTTNYEVGSLAVVDLSDQSVDESTDIPSDAAVVAEDGQVFLLGRYGYDYVRIYDPAQGFATPVLEFSVGDAANPQDLEICGDKLVVSKYGSASLGVYDPATGNVAGSVDLSSYADEDGIPEATELVEAGGMLYVSLNGLDQDNGWVGVGGQVLQVDCGSWTVTDAWDIGGNTSISAWDDSRIFVTHDAFGEVPAGLSILDPGNDSFETVLSYDQWTTLPLSVVETNGTALVVLRDGSYNYGWQCFDSETWASKGDATMTNWFLGGAALSSQGQAWIPAGSHWSNTADSLGAVVADPADCSEQGVAEATLGGSSVALY